MIYVGARLRRLNVLVCTEQNALLLACQPFLTSMLSIALSHNWLACSLNVMHLHAALAQATFPGNVVDCLLQSVILKTLMMGLYLVIRRRL